MRQLSCSSTWRGYDDPQDHTWEREKEDLQLTARLALLDFWAAHPTGGRNAALSRADTDADADAPATITYRVLRIVDGPREQSQPPRRRHHRLEQSGDAMKTSTNMDTANKKSKSSECGGSGSGTSSSGRENGPYRRPD